MEAYPHSWDVDTSLAELISKYSDLEDGARIDEASLSLWAPTKQPGSAQFIADGRGRDRWFFVNNVIRRWPSHYDGS